uniref:Uncharacterized protein n=1 Tax=Setaria italica TaxID=4555 RepID=K4A3Q0_SETIT
MCNDGWMASSPCTPSSEDRFQGQANTFQNSELMLLCLIG